MLLAVALAKKLGGKELTAVSLHLGIAMTKLSAHLDWNVEYSGSQHNGAYLVDSHIADPDVDTVKHHALDHIEADRLWKLSEELVGQKFEYWLQSATT
ncbi:MAG: hypothetical protein MMC33_005577 [Icmadophila ericetorum]|nr:hypothetical protein [Icmadophila ericetorum]